MQHVAHRRSDEIHQLRAEIERLRGGLDAAIRAANLALFVINKHGVMPNDSWKAGFQRDLEAAKAALGDEQTEHGLSGADGQ